MHISCGKTLKNARIMRKMNVKKAARELNMSSRNLYNYESNKFKIPDPQIFANGMTAYRDIKVGLSYMNENPVSKLLLGFIKLTDPLTAAIKYTEEHNGDNETDRILKWALSDGKEPLLDWIVRKVRNATHSHMDLLFNIYQRQGFAY